MIKGLVTIVLPIYNVEKYLDRCVESVVNQTYQNIEIIMVDDGSPDSCPAKCDEWAKKDSRIKVVHKQNAGLGMARNTGIENATGEYICFFDSDDYVRLDTVEKSYQTASAEGADVVIFGHQSVYANGKTGKASIPYTPKNVYENEEVQEKFLPLLFGRDIKTGAYTGMGPGVWKNFYSMSLFTENDLRFHSEREIISEDVHFSLELYAYVKKVAIIPEVFYYYFKNEASLTHVYRKDRYEQTKKCYDVCMALCEEKGYNDDVKVNLWGPYVGSLMSTIKQIMQADMSGKERKRCVYEIMQDEHLHRVLQKNVLGKKKFFQNLVFSLISKKWYGLAYILLFWWVKIKK